MSDLERRGNTFFGVISLACAMAWPIYIGMHAATPAGVPLWVFLAIAGGVVALAALWLAAR